MRTDSDVIQDEWEKFVALISPQQLYLYAGSVFVLEVKIYRVEIMQNEINSYIKSTACATVILNSVKMSMVKMKQKIFKELSNQSWIHDFEESNRVELLIFYATLQS